MSTRRKKRRITWSVPRITDPRFPGMVYRVGELDAGGSLYLFWMEDGRQRMRSLRHKRADLGTDAKEQERQARVAAIAAMEEHAAKQQRSAEVPAPEPGEVLTLGALADLYKVHGFHGRSERYQKEQTATVNRVVDFLGRDRGVPSLCKTDVKAWTAHRRANGVRQGTIASDLAALKIALNFATDHKRADGSALVEFNPIARVRIEKEGNPLRPVADVDRYQKLKDVAHHLPPSFGLALDLVWATGHRIGAVLGLRWADVILDPEEAARVANELDSGPKWKAGHFVDGGIRWYAGQSADNKKRDHVALMSALAREALDAARPDICPPDAWVFPAPKDATKPVGYHVVKNWMERAQTLAELPHLKGGLWHPFRRRWATDRKHLPEGDVAKAGGWRDPETMKRSYIAADADTIRAAVING
jgi:integrase